MKWGMYADVGRPDEEPPLVYFGGRTLDTIFGFGGSSKNVVGVTGTGATGSRSGTPYLVARILEGLEMPSRGWNAFSYFHDGHDYQTFQAVAHATTQMKGPEQNLEFFARVLLKGDARRSSWYVGGDKDPRVILGTPLYVALAAPYPSDLW